MEDRVNDIEKKLRTEAEAMLPDERLKNDIKRRLLAESKAVEKPADETYATDINYEAYATDMDYEPYATDIDYVSYATDIDYEADTAFASATQSSVFEATASAASARNQAARNLRKHKNSVKMARIMSACAATVCLVMGLTFGLYFAKPQGGGGTGGGGGNGGGGIIPPKNVSVTETIGMSVYSTAKLLGGMGGASGASTLATADIETTSGASTLAIGDPSEEEIGIINKYLNMVESFISSNPMVITELTAEEIAAAGKIAFKHGLKIVTKDMTGKATAYLLYYNQTLIADDDRDDDFNDLETEQEFRLVGEMVLPGATADLDKTYNIEGKTENETEVENGVTETETELYIKASDAKGNYVKFKQEIEHEGNEFEQEFKYELGIHNIAINSFSLKIENERGQQEVKLKITDPILNGSSISFKKMTENTATGTTEYIRISVSLPLNTKLSMKVIIKTNEQTGEKSYHYELAGGGHFDKDRYDD